MGLNVGNLPVKQVYVGSTPVKAVYVGSTLVWQDREVVQITLGTGVQARDQFQAALSARGLNYQTVTELPFDIELLGTGSAREMFQGCSSLTSVPDMDTSQVTDARNMFYNCSSLTDGNVRLIGRHPSVTTFGMITLSGLTREPFYDAADNPDPGPTNPRVVTISTSTNKWRVGTQAGDVSMIQALTGPFHLVFSVPVTCNEAINAGNNGTLAAGTRLEAGWVLAPVRFRDLQYTFTEII